MGWLKNLQKAQLKDLNILDKKSHVREELRRIDEHTLQPTWDVLKGLALSPIVEFYVNYVENQAKGKYKPLPQWLKLILEEKKAYDIDLTKREGPNRVDVEVLLHELEHVVQYKTQGGVNAFLIKYIIQAGGTSLGSLQSLNAKSVAPFVSHVHNGIPMEKEADAKSASLINYVMEELKDLSLGRPTVILRSLGNRLNMTGERLFEGDYLQSQNGLYRLICQGDGNLVLYGPGDSVVWATYTDGIGKPIYAVVAQPDRNFVLVDRERVIWSSDTHIAPNPVGCFIILQDDGNLVMYQPVGPNPVAVWSTLTAGK